MGALLSAPSPGPIWGYPAAASDACASMASILFCCRTAPRRGRAHWSPAAVEREAWAVCSGLCCPSLQTLSPLPCSLPPEASREESPPGGLCCHFSAFSTWSGEEASTPLSHFTWGVWSASLDWLGMGNQRLDQPLVSSIRASQA